VRVLRDSFSGAVACHDVKFKIEVVVTPLRRSPDLKQALTGMIKLCENNLRAVFGVKSRFVPSGVGEELKNAVSAYFDEIYPERNQKKRKSAAALEEERYMALYEPENKGPADISRALEIEAAAWETAELLDTGEDEPESTEAAICADASPLIAKAPMDMVPEQTADEKHEPKPSAEISEENADFGEFSFLLSLDPLQKDSLLAAREGTFDAFCRSRGKMAETVCASINEIAMDAIGDIILEEDFSLVPDYEEDILAVIGEE
jgi:hypothetical protein